MGRPKVDKRNQRATSSFLVKGIEEINLEIRKAYSSVTGLDKLWGTYTKINKADAEECFMKYKGRCVFCDKTLSFLGRYSKNAARLMWYVPLNVGGEARPDNLVVVCGECKHGYRSTRKLREDVFGLDSFADTCTELFRAVQRGADDTDIDRLKNRLNIRLADVATCMRYVVKMTPEPAGEGLLIEGENTIPDLLADVEENKDKITEAVDRMVKRRQYKVIRPQETE